MCEKCPGYGTPEYRAAITAQRQRHQKMIFAGPFMDAVAKMAREPRWAKYGPHAQYEAAMAAAMEDPEIGDLYWYDAEITPLPDGRLVFVVWHEPEGSDPFGLSKLKTRLKPWVRESESAIRRLFEKVRAMPMPTIVFVDGKEGA